MTADEPGAERPSPEPPSGRLTWLLPATSGNLEYDRILFFSDAIFAIAITLLVVTIKLPSLPAGQVPAHYAAHALDSTVPQMVGFGISFAVIGMFWVGHHGIFRHISVIDRRLIWLNLLFLGTVAFLPYPTSLISVAGNQTAAVVFYAIWVSFAGLTEAALWVYACRVPGLLDPETPAELRWYLTLRILRAPLVFLLSIPVAFAAPGIAPYTWLTVAVLGFAFRRLAAARQRRTAAAGPAGSRPAPPPPDDGRPDRGY